MSFSPRSVIYNITGKTARRLFQYLDSSVQTDWGDDAVFAPSLALAAFNALDKERKDRFIQLLGEIYRIASDAGAIKTLRERLRAHGVAPPGETPADSYEFAANAFFDHPKAWCETRFFAEADDLPERKWHLFEVEGDFPDADPVPGVRGELAEAVRETWRRGSFGFGRRVEFSYALREGRYEYYVAEVDHYPRENREFTGEGFASRLVTPVCGISMIYDRVKRTLRAGTTVPFVRVPSIAANWARVVKGASLHAICGEEVRPMIENLIAGELTLDPAGRIVSVRRSAIKATRFGNEGSELILRERSSRDALEVFREEIVQKELTLDDYIVHEVKLTFVLRSPAGEPETVTVTVKEDGWLHGKMPNWAYEIVCERLMAWEVIDAIAA